ncbi:DNA cytosine methyltransferase [Granulicella sp. L60]|uniref:DNA cytosine methyltransferase n=1 Tax=Granulicella sp. L60 TaxID=1641866 RepID=UPI001C2060D0
MPVTARERLAKKIKVFDFFSGCGGTSAGLRDVGMDIVFALDFDPEASKTFQRNFPTTKFVKRDVRYFETCSIENLVSEWRSKDHPILFSGCAPCQPFSQQNGQRNDEDERIPLLTHFGRFVKAYSPDFVLIENVPGIQTISSTAGPLPKFLRTLTKMGYSVAAGTVDCCSYGVPQKRSRFVLLASLLGDISLPKRSHGPGAELASFSTVNAWISDLPPIQAGETHSSVPNHRAAKLSPLNLARIRATPIGGGRRDWPEDLQLTCHAQHKGHTDVYGRLRWDAPASALTTRCISLSNGRFGHPTQARAISVREAARLQTFDDSFEFTGSLNSMAKQIGNAVPVLLAKSLGRAFTTTLNGTGRG